MFVFLASISLMWERNIYLELWWPVHSSVLFIYLEEKQTTGEKTMLKVLSHFKEKDTYQKGLCDLCTAFLIWSLRIPPNAFKFLTLWRRTVGWVFSHFFSKGHTATGLATSRYFRFEVFFYTFKTKKYAGYLSMLILKSSSSIFVCLKNEAFKLASFKV